MVANGANAGNLSPISLVGLVVDNILGTIGFPDAIWRAMALNFVSHAAVTLVAFAVFGGRGLLAASVTVEARAAAPPLERRHWLTLVATTVWIAAVVALALPPGLSALAAVCVLIVARAANECEVIRRAPWSAILMVTGMTTLVTVVEKTGGLELFARLLADMTNPRW
jgi:Na+/H+ antiporter NhaD/arsenite permease-like protein